MRLASLYLRSRLTGPAAAILLAVGALAWGLVRLAKGEPMAVYLALALMPLAAAVVVGASARSPFGDIERTASYPLPAMRLGHLAGLLLLGALSLALAGADWRWEAPGWVLARNLLGYAGLAFLGARVLGVGLSWVPPLAYGVLSVAIGVIGQTDDGETAFARWAWPLHPAAHRPSALLALSLLAAGIALVALLGARDGQGEAS